MDEGALGESTRVLVSSVAALERSTDSADSVFTVKVCELAAIEL